MTKDITFIQGAVASSEVLRTLQTHHYDIAIITLTPGQRDDNAYQQTYVDNSRQLIKLWRNSQTCPRLVIFVSSTAVYAQQTGEWVDEDSVTNPVHYSGKRMLEAENLWRQSGVNHCIVRFSGIYGPGRHYLINQVKAGVAGGDQFTNRIHIDDCVVVLLQLCHCFFSGKGINSTYIGSDCQPIIGKELSAWLAKEMGLTEPDSNPQPSPGRAGNKRCSNKRLLESGYIFKFPSYQDGYQSLLDG